LAKLAQKIGSFYPKIIVQNQNILNKKILFLAFLYHNCEVDNFRPEDAKII